MHRLRTQKPPNFPNKNSSSCTFLPSLLPSSLLCRYFPATLHGTSWERNCLLVLSCWRLSAALSQALCQRGVRDCRKRVHWWSIWSEEICAGSGGLRLRRGKSDFERSEGGETGARPSHYYSREVVHSHEAIASFQWPSNKGWRSVCAAAVRPNPQK